MATARPIKTLMTGITSIVLIEWFSPIDTLINHAFKRLPIDSNFATPALANTPQKARPAFATFRQGAVFPKVPKQLVRVAAFNPSNLCLYPLTLLVPNDHDGMTISGHPTFFWHVSAPVPMAFALTERGVVQPLWEQQLQPQAAGITQLEMPNNLPELVPGREYRWSITLLCNPERPSANPFIQTWIRRVPVTPTLTQQLTATSSNRDRASIYAQAGLWYDALSAISTAHTVNPNDPSIIEERLLLLDQVGLNQVTAQERQRLARQ